MSAPRTSTVPNRGTSTPRRWRASPAGRRSRVLVRPIRGRGDQQSGERGVLGAAGGDVAVPWHPVRTAQPTAGRRGIGRGRRTADHRARLPTAPEAKGSHLVRSMIRTLQSQGIAIDYKELQGLPNHEVLAALRDADLAIDQLYSDTPLPKFATEASSFGLPVVVGGYSWDFLRSVLPDNAVWPAICRPQDALETVRRLTKNADERAGIGSRCQEFVHRADPGVGGRPVPHGHPRRCRPWRYDPLGSHHVHGCGLSEDAGESVYPAAHRAVRRAIADGARQARS